MGSATMPARLSCKYRGKSSNGNVYLCSCERESMCAPTCKMYTQDVVHRHKLYFLQVSSGSCSGHTNVQRYTETPKASSSY